MFQLLVLSVLLYFIQGHKELTMVLSSNDQNIDLFEIIYFYCAELRIAVLSLLKVIF